MQVINQLVLDENNKIAFHPAIGNSYQLNDTGTLIINMLKQYKTNEEIISELSKIYEIPPEELFIDICDFITKLRFYGLL